MHRREFIGRTLCAAGAALAPLSCAHVRVPAGRRAAVRNGIDVLAAQNFAPLKSLRIGLITNHTGHDRLRRPTIDLLKSAPGVKLVSLFSPEHGIRGMADEKVGDTVDEKTGLPVFSLYGTRRTPAAEQLQGLDALVYDIQDIGCRFYTFPSTLGLCLEAAGAARLKFFVLDRVNPINGIDVEGPVHHGKSSFTAFHSVPLRHGMTVGELARMFDAERKFNADLTVVPVEGWRRADWFDETGLPWTNPSPNMRSLAGATLYPGLGLHETSLCVGRGTDKPFELAGAPYIDDVRLAAELAAASLPGIHFVPIRFTPTYSTFKDKPCAGVAFTIADRARLKSVDFGITLALVLQRLYPQENTAPTSNAAASKQGGLPGFALTKVNTLLQDTATIDAIRSGRPLAEIKSRWSADLRTFHRRRQPFLLYS